MYMTAHFTTSKIPARVKEIRFPGVSGFRTLAMGNEYYEIRQEGMVDFGELQGSSQHNVLRKIMFKDQPGVFLGETLITVDTQDGEIYPNCYLINCEISRVNPRIVNYEYTWKQQYP